MRNTSAPSLGRRRAVGAVAVVLGLGVVGGACSGDDEDSSADAPAATAVAAALDEAADANTRMLDADVGVAADAAEVAVPAAAPAPGVDPAPAGPSELGLQLEGTLAITASASLRVEDVRRAVDQVTGAVETAGGRIASATVDYPDATGRPDASDPTQAYALLTLSVPPDQLDPLVDRLGEFGEIATFEQHAVEVGDQLADLDTRIGNARASVERARELLAEATTVQDLVFVEAELTRRETDLELLLASQQQLEDRVAMSTLTLDISTVVATAPTFQARHEIEVNAVGAAFADGWHAFTGTVVAIIVAVASSAPFLAVLALVGAAVVFVRRRTRAADTDRTRSHRLHDDPPIATDVASST